MALFPFASSSLLTLRKVTACAVHSFVFFFKSELVQTSPWHWHSLDLEATCHLCFLPWMFLTGFYSTWFLPSIGVLDFRDQSTIPRRDGQNTVATSLLGTLARWRSVMAADLKAHSCVCSQVDAVAGDTVLSPVFLLLIVYVCAGALEKARGRCCPGLSFSTLLP